MRAWAEKNNFSNLDKHFDYFISKARANGYTYADWDQALMNAIRDNWAQVGGTKPNGNGGGGGTPWWRSNAGIEAKGRELGIPARGGESYADYAARITAKIEAGNHA